jgi:hypothetical protein
MSNSGTQQMQNRQSVAPEVLTLDQLEQVVGGQNPYFGPHLIGGANGLNLPMPPIGPVGPILPIGPGPLGLIGAVIGAFSN